MYRSRYNRRNNSTLGMQLLCKNLPNYSKKLLNNVLFGENTLGLLLRHEKVSYHQKYVMSVRRISLLKEKSIYSVMSMNLLRFN